MSNFSSAADDTQSASYIDEETTFFTVSRQKLLSKGCHNLQLGLFDLVAAALQAMTLPVIVQYPVLLTLIFTPLALHSTIPIMHAPCLLLLQEYD